MAAQDALQILMNDKLRPYQPREAENHREEPRNAPNAGLIGKLDVELREVDLRLLAWWRLEANLEADGGWRSQRAG